MMLEVMLTELHAALATVDRLQRTARCGPSLALHYCEVRRAVLQYVATQRAHQTAVDEFVVESVRLFRQCEEVYAALYVAVYEALDRNARRRQTSGVERASIKASSVPIDPQSALNVVECGDAADGRLYVTLHNDNETLLKFPPSALFRQEGIGATVDAIEAFYARQCEAIHVTYMARLHTIRAHSREQTELAASLADAVRLACVALRASTLEEEEAEEAEVYAQTERLVEYSASVNAEQATKRANCELFQANVHAKFLVCAQLMDNMLRPYHLTRLHQASATVDSVF